MYRSLNRFYLICLLICIQMPIQAQSITLTPVNPTEFFVCGTGDFEFTLTNGDEALSDVLLTIQFSTQSGTACGMTFNNANGITPVSPIDSLQPMFDIGDLAVNESINFTITADAPCSVFDCLNNAELFQNNFVLSHSGGTIAIPPSPIYTVETANLVITDITPSFGTVTQGDVFTRTITIRNTRLGPLTEFTFCDEHQGGFCIVSGLGQVIEEDSFIFCLQLNANDFMTIGDGDGLFEKDEVIVIEEEVEVKACGGVQQSSLSDISIGWGCDGNLCQEDKKIVGLSFLPTTLNPSLIFDPITTVPECFCGSEPFLQGMVVTNIGTGAALDLNLTTRQFTPKGGMDLPSFYVDSAGVQIDISVVPATSEPFEVEDPPCEIDPEIWRRAVANFPEIAPGESITFYWETYLCDQICLGEFIEWKYGYEYASVCGEEVFVVDSIPVVATGDALSTKLILEDGPLTDGMTHVFNYEINYADLDSEDGTLTVELEVPCGLTWEDTNNPILGGMTPTISIEPMDEFQLVTLVYDMPMPNDTLSTSFEMSFACAEFCTDDLLCKDSIITSCMGIDSCIIETEVQVIIPIITSVNHCEPFPNECAPQSCISPLFTQTCEIDSFCIEEVPGYINYRFDAARSNFGFADNDNDQICDGFGPPDLNLINDHRLLPGDTIHAEISGEVVVDIPGSTFANGIIDLFITGGQTSGVNNDFFTPDGVVPMAASIRIFDSSTNTYYDCEAPLTELTNAPFFLKYDYSPAVLSAAGCNVPADLVFENGDSIFFEMDFKINKNIIKEDDATPLQVRLNLIPSILIYNDPVGNLDEIFRCGCAQQSFEVTGYEINTFPGVFAVPPCEESEFIGGSLFQILLEEGNYFPFECRRLATLTDFKLDLPEEFDLIESKLTFLRNQDGGDIVNEQPLIPELNGDQVCFDVANFQMDGLDEGFLGLFQYRFTADCELTGSHILVTTATLDLLDQLPEENDPLDFVVESPALRSLTPNLIVSTPLCDITAFNNQAILDFDLINFQTIVASQASGTAQNVWIYPISNSGLITNCTIFNANTNQPIPQINGIFQLDSLPALDTLNLRLVCENTSCELEEVELNFGWSCDPFTNPINLTCNTEVKNLTFIAPPSQLELTVEGPDSCSDLCDTIPYHTLEIFNAGLGTAYHVEITAQVPTGITYLSGSTEIEYPCDSGNFISTADPIELPNGDLIWSACDVLPSLEDCGLPPVIFDDNCFRMRFLSQSSCDLVINSFFIFSITGEQNCGDPTNTLADIGENICINDIEPPFTGTISLNGTDVICENVNSQLVTIQLNGDTQFGDCLILETPNGITANCVEFINPSFACDVDTTNGNYIIALPPGVPAGQFIALNLETVGFQNLECGEYNMTLQAATQTLAECLAIQDTCSTKVVVASTIASLSVDRPIFELSNFNITASPSGLNDLINFEIDVTNTGAPAPPVTTIEFYLNNGLVHSENINVTIQIDETIPLSGSFEIGENMLCNLTATINPICACDVDTISISNPIIYLTGQNDTICSTEMIAIGIEEQAGFVYQWTAPDDPNCLDYLTCTTCSLANFSFENLEKEPKTCHFILLESDNMGCIIQNQISITVQPTPEICLGDSPICIGEVANLCASEGVSFTWDPIASDEQCINVTPLQTTTYFVTIIDAQGCTGTDNFTVEVVELPTSDLPATYLFCGDDTPQLDANFNENYTYNWSPGTPVLDNPAIADPIIEIPMDGIYSVTITDQFGCQIIVETDVTFGETPDLSISIGPTVCIGTPVVITASGANTYEWAAPITPADCLDANCSQISITPLETTTYTVVGTSFNGCTASISSTVTVVDGEINTEETRTICEGEESFIFGELESEPGMYSETYALPAGCDSTHTITLIVNPTIEENLSVEICEGESFTFNGMEFSESGIFPIVLESSEGCDSTISLNLTLNALPDLTIGGPTEIAVGDTISFSAPTGFQNYEWTSSTGNDLTNCDGSPECMDSPMENTTYTLLVTDENGCQGTALFAVQVIIQCNPIGVEIPNAFTPNGDGSNDVFAPVFEDAGQEQVISMKIWNRWGEKVFEGGQSATWDGNFDGSPAAADVYIYTIELECRIGEEEDIKTGDVTLIR